MNCKTAAKEQCFVFSEKIPAKTREHVSENRDSYYCPMCGVMEGDMHPHDGIPAVIHVGCIDGGNAENINDLRRLCCICKEGLEDMQFSAPDKQAFLNKIRNANRKEQKNKYDWLRVQF